MYSPREMSASAAARREPRVDVATVAAEEVGMGSAEAGVDTVAAEEVGLGSAEVGVDSVEVVVSAGVDLVGLSPVDRLGVKVNHCSLFVYMRLHTSKYVCERRDMYAAKIRKTYVSK